MLYFLFSLSGSKMLDSTTKWGNSAKRSTLKRSNIDPNFPVRITLPRLQRQVNWSLSAERQICRGYQGSKRYLTLCLLLTLLFVILAPLGKSKAVVVTHPALVTYNFTWRRSKSWKSPRRDQNGEVWLTTQKRGSRSWRFYHAQNIATLSEKEIFLAYYGIDILPTAQCVACLTQK